MDKLVQAVDRSVQGNLATRIASDFMELIKVSTMSRFIALEGEADFDIGKNLSYTEVLLKMRNSTHFE